MLFVRVLDSQRDHQEAFAFALTETGEFVPLSGDAGLVDRERAFPGGDGAPVTRRDPRRWVDALARAAESEGRYVVEAGEPKTAPAGDPPRARRRHVLQLAGLALSVCVVALGLAAWKEGYFDSASGDTPAAPTRSASGQKVLIRPPALRVHGNTAAQRRLESAADDAARELVGSGDDSGVSWDSSTGLWDFLKLPPGTPASFHLPTWWQSAIAMDAIVRYATVAHNTSAAYQRLLARIYKLDVQKPGSLAPHDFEDRYMDDTAWWGIAWADAARYELRVMHDRTTAAAYLALAQDDTNFLESQPKHCGGDAIPFRDGYAPNTITDSEFIDMAARVAQLRSSGPLADPGLAQKYTREALGTLHWFEGSGLIDLSTGGVRLGENDFCRPSGRAQTYTEGEVADALTQVGLLTHQRRYYNDASVFLNHVLRPSSGMLVDGVLQEQCEGEDHLCLGQSLNITAFKGIFDEAAADWAQATGSTTYDGFLTAQAQAVIANSTGLAHGACSSPHNCQLSMYWARDVPVARQPLPATSGSQASGLYALANGLSVSARG